MDLSCPICIFMISAYLNYLLGRYSFLIIVLGGLLAYVRHIAVTCYRLSVYCPFPFNF